MVFKVTQSIQGDVWSVLFSGLPGELTERDKLLMKQHGEPQINVGGTFLVGTADEFSFPEAYRALHSGFPYKRNFDSRDVPFDTNTKVKILAYRDAIIARMTAGLDILRNFVDSYTKELLVTIGSNDYVHSSVIARPIYGEIPAGVINGTNHIFTSAYPLYGGILAVYLNGLRIQNADLTVNFTTQFQLTDAPLTNDVVSIDYRTLS